MAWLDLGVIQAYQSSADLADLDTSRRRARILESTGPLFGPLSGESANITITLSDPAMLIPLLTDPPLTATLYYRDKQNRLISFDGAVGRVSLGASVQVNLNA